MANRSEKVEFYVTPDKKQEIEHAADEAEMTVSSWCASRIDEILHQDALEAKNQEYQAEQRIEEKNGCPRRHGKEIRNER